MKKGNRFILPSLILIPLIAGVFYVDLAGTFNYSDIPFAIALLLYVIFVILQHADYKMTFVIALFCIILMGLSYVPTAASRMTERFGEWFYVFFLFGLVQYTKSLLVRGEDIVELKNDSSRCVLCRNNLYSRLFPGHDRMHNKPGVFSVLKCRSCGLVRVDPIPNALKLAMYYPKNYYSFVVEQPGIFGRLRSYLILHSLNQSFVSRVATLLFRVPAIPKFVKNGILLDIGCGNGDTLVLLKQIGWDTYGLEIDKDAVTNARKRGLDKVRFGSYSDIAKYPDNYFDVIRLYHVIEHLSDPDTCVRLIYKKLKRYGSVIIGTPNAEGIIAKLSGTYWYNLDTPRHLEVFSNKTLPQLIKKNKLKITKTEYCSGGGILGTIQYFLADKIHLKAKMIDNPILFALFYPLERFLDWCKLGDVITIEAIK